jgi:hypothetical protein
MALLSEDAIAEVACPCMMPVNFGCLLKNTLSYLISPDIKIDPEDQIE